MRYLVALVLMFMFGSAQAQERSPLMPERNSLFVRFVDTGGGLATITVVTGDSANQRKVMIFDAGHWNADNVMIDELRHYIGRRLTIDVMVISHVDSDHLGTADTVLQYWNVRKAVRTGWEREAPPATYRVYMRKLRESVAQKGTEDLAMGDGSPAIGEAWQLGDASLTFLSGFAEVPDDWDVGGNSTSKKLNSVSVVARLDYAGKSILFTGDAVGRSDDGPSEEILGTEKFLVDNSEGERTIKADILQAPHHGANNASSGAFIQAVDPDFVIFPSGSAHAHPREAAWHRYELAGISAEKMFRTDVGDPADEKQQSGGWDDSCADTIGDDGVSILIKANGEITVDQDPVEDQDRGC